MAKRPLTHPRAARAPRRAGPRPAESSRAPATRGDIAPPAVQPRAPARVAGLDALRGVAIVAMIVYHFCFDLRYFGITRWDFEHDLRWLTARTLILSSFLLIAGASAVLAARSGPRSRALRHVALIAAAALGVSVASWLMFPRTYIWFGVLHAIAASLVIALPLLARPMLAAIAGVAVIACGVTFAHPAFDNRLLGWIGFMTAKPSTEDYVPLFPWTGVLLVGIAAGHALVRTRFAALAPLAKVPPLLQWLGRHSLAVYLVHQPVMIGALWLATRR